MSSSTRVPRRSFLTASASLCATAAAPLRAAIPFDAWLADVRDEARRAGISEGTLERALAGIEPLPEVIELDGRQPERRYSFVEYRERVLSPARIERGQFLRREHRHLLDEVARHYAVPASLIVALWGLESTYGRMRPRFPVIPALATLAHEGRRRSFFKGELLAALRIVDAGQIEPAELMGSWAGAMGQCQFMPSSYLDRAQDFDGDGRVDIWQSLPDVFASIAHYMARAGWDGRYTWGRPVRLPADLDPAWAGRDRRASLAKWQRRGVRTARGGPLPAVPIEASLLQMSGGPDADYLVYANFDALMRWNRSSYFGLTVGLLADLVEDG